MSENSQLEALEQVEQQIKNTDTSIDLGAMSTELIKSGAETAIEVISKQAGNTILDQLKGKTVEKTVGTVGKAAIFLNMAINVYNIAKGEFKWDLAGTLNFVTTTLIVLAALGVKLATLGAITAALSSNPFTMALAIITMIIAYFEIGDAAAEIKKQYMVCFNTYRRTYKLCNWIETNTVIYNSLEKVLDMIENSLQKMKQEYETVGTGIMKRKIFVGADFNSFALFTNVITFIQARQTLSTAKDGVYNDYIDFCSIIDYIDTKEVLQQDKARIEYFILQNDTDGLNNFYISIDYLLGYFDTYLEMNTDLTSEVKQDINYVIKCVKELESVCGTSEILKKEYANETLCNDTNRLFNSIYAKLIYASAMSNSPYKVCNTLLNQEYYKEQSIYSYVTAFSEYPIYLFTNWFFAFGSVMFNEVYITKYQKEMLNVYTTNLNYINTEAFNDIMNDINMMEGYSRNQLWLNAIKEFLQNLIDYQYKNCTEYYLTSITQTGVNEDGKVLYNYYIPNKDIEYLIPDIKTVITNFVKYFSQTGYDYETYGNLLNEFKTLTTYNDKFKVRFLNFKCLDRMTKASSNGILGLLANINNNIYDLFNNITKAFNPKENFAAFKEAIKQKTNHYLLNNNTAYSVDYAGHAFTNNYLEFDINDIDYYGTSENINDFYYRILLRTRDLRYLFAYLVIIFDTRWTALWGGCFFEIAYIFSKSQKLRDMFFDGYIFKLTNNIDEYLKSLWQFIKGEREDVIFYWADNNTSGGFNIWTFVNDMCRQTKFQDGIKNLYLDFKQSYNDYRDMIKQDIDKSDILLDKLNTVERDLKGKYSDKYDSFASYLYVGKYDTQVWNLYQECTKLRDSSYSTIKKITKHLVPVYKLEDNFIKFESYYSPMFILLKAKDDTDLSQAYYLVNKDELNTLFNVGDEKFNEKIKKYQDIADTTIQSNYAIINHDEIIEQIALNIKKTYELSKEEMIDLIGSQEDEFIMIQNLLNTQILSGYKDDQTLTQEQANALLTNSKVAAQTEQEINNNLLVLDKNKIIKYSIAGGLLLILLNKLRSKKQ